MIDYMKRPCGGEFLHDRHVYQVSVDGVNTWRPTVLPEKYECPGNDVAIDTTPSNDVPSTWCVVQCPKCDETWSIDTAETKPPLTGVEVEAIMIPILQKHFCK